MLNIASMNTADLLALLEQIPGEIKRRETEDKKRVRKELEDLAAKSGYSLDELLEEAIKMAVKTRKPVQIRYRSPDGENTWTGRGRTPKWLAEALGDGKSKEDFAV